MRSILSILMTVLVSGMLCSGCGAPNTMIRSGPDPLSEGLTMARETVVFGAAGWQNTGVSLKKGMPFTVTASGIWKAGGALPECGPEGYAPGMLASYDGSLGCMSLIGRIDGGRHFLIGSYETRTADADGELELRPNDTDLFLFDNVGTLKAKIYLPASPQVADRSRPQYTAEPTEPAHAAPPREAPARFASQSRGQTWAVIVGLSKYRDSRIPELRYADRDAQALYDWVVSPDGGRFAPSHVRLLINEDATGEGIKDALFSWLKQALEEDVVVIYFAGHGSPESPDSPNNLYLLPYDTRYDAISSTAFPMWDIETALKRFVKAKKVVVLADACHAGGVGESFDKAVRGDRRIAPANGIGNGLQGLSNVGDGVCVITASDERQFSQESDKWGGGHGIFTYFLLDGLKGDADYNKDGVVTLGELIPYLSEQVRRGSGNTQSPTVGGKFDPALSIAR